MKNRFTVGEMSKLHNIPVKTLRYYDEIDLFKPLEVSKENGYRYYSTEQFEELNTIKYLKTLGISLKEIMRILHFSDVESFLNLLEEEKKATEDKIRELTMVRDRFENRIMELKKAKEISDMGEVSLVQVAERPIIRLLGDIKSTHELELSLRKLENHYGRNSTVMIGNVGLSISKENMEKGIYNQYNSIYILLPDYSDEVEDRIPAGKYVSTFYKGDDHKESHIYYEKIKKFISDNGYRITGDALERVIINRFITKIHDEHVTEIIVPVEKA